ncbi:MAG TPA: spore coat protein U domain-containing protein [Sphingomonas sp.]|nr:spore coat protein U domain-containing protein [Sphingomonas sp.]
MNKMILKTAIAAIAVIGFAGAAQAQTHSSSQTVYSDNTLQFINSIGFPDVAQSVWDFDQSPLGQLFGVQQLSGSRYHQQSDAPDNEDAATTSTGGKFTLTGHVTPDCSFYNGGVAQDTAHTIDLGTIGVHTGNGDNVSIAFNQMSTAHANVNTATAGCNTRNNVTITKNALINANPGLYDSNEFTATIPYEIHANWTNASGDHAINLGQQQSSDTKTGGAWRSAFNMNIDVPPPSKGLVAGDYQDTITVTISVA